MRTCSSGGTFLRLADPDWEHPLDAAVSMARGGRWHPPGSFPVVYLNGDLPTARANACLLIEESIEGMPFGFEDLDPLGLPVLVPVHLPSGDILDARTATGLESAGLPATFPRRPAGDPVPLQACQRVGMRAHQAGLARIAYRSAAYAAGSGEVAWFTDLGGPPQAAGPIVAFDDWFWDQAADGISH